MQKEDSFIKEGRKRIKAAVERYLGQEEQRAALEKFPEAPEFISIGYLPFALSALPPYQEIEVDGLPWFTDRMLPHPLLIACKWEEAVDWTLSKPEKDYLRYLGYKSWFWWEGFYIPKGKESNLLLNEALLDTLQEEGNEQKVTREVFERGRLSKYLRAIRVKWEVGNHFEALRRINPAEVGLPDFGSSLLEDMPHTRGQAVLLVLAEAYNLGNEDRNSDFVTLRKIAEEESLPYITLLEAKYNSVKNQ